MELTARQTEILNLIRSHIRDTGFPPTRAEICKIMGFSSPNAAEDHLRALARKGAIEVLPGISRGIRILAPGKPEGLPVVGRVGTGRPILAEEHIEDHCLLDPTRFRPRAHYLLRMPDPGMHDAGILKGDLLAVHRTRRARNGQILVLRLEDEVIVRRFRRHGRWKHRIRLLPENPDFKPVDLDLREQSLVIEGRAVGLLRTDLGKAADAPWGR
ncbi:MAG TPA: transcriptional repressor LexA [Sedimenticola sp.]|nr:transcriptional repressor LexA [Sedimenticola sp.]